MTAMRVRRLIPVLVVTLTASASADTFGGFSGVDRPYLVNQDKVCTPLKPSSGAATGAARCERVSADVIAKLSFKRPIPQRGAQANFAAAASGRTLTVTRKTGDPVVTWDAPDPIGKVVDVFASQYNDRVAVAFSIRRMGKQVTEVIGFDLGRASAPPVKDPPTPPVGKVPMPADDPAVTKAVAVARKASTRKALAAWQAVVGLDPDHAEAHYQIAAAKLAAKRPAEALAALTTLASSSRADAIEWLVDARFAKAFAALRADGRFRALVGLDRSPSAPRTTYERLMGFGGKWEQTGTSCDKPEVRLTATRDRVVRIRVKSVCGGRTYDLPFKGTWRLDGDHVVLTMPNRGKQVTAEDQAGCEFETVGDEDALRCTLGRDLDFVVLPTRR